jgi:hypothetical protein
MPKTRFLRFSTTLGARPGQTPTASQEFYSAFCRTFRPLSHARTTLAPRAGVAPRRIFEKLTQIVGRCWYPLITFKPYNTFSILKFLSTEGPWGLRELPQERILSRGLPPRKFQSWSKMAIFRIFEKSPTGSSNKLGARSGAV